MSVDTERREQAAPEMAPAAVPAPAPPTSQPVDPSDGTLPILIFAPAFARSSSNSGTRVAELIAKKASILPGTYKVVDRSEQGTGLRVCKTIVGPDGSPVLDVLELDYLSRLEDADLIGRGASAPGFVRSGFLAIRGMLMLVPAIRRAGKSARARMQLLWGFGSLVVLLLLAVVAIVTSLHAMGIGDGFIGDDNAAVISIGSGVAVAGIWARYRPQFTAGAERIERMMNFADDPRYRAAVVRTVWEALDGLRDRTWRGPIHLVGFSFGSLVLLDALFPQRSRDGETLVDPNLRDLASMVTSLTTIGCPADFARLYWPRWFEDRWPYPSNLEWINVLNASDVFGSNFRDDDDTTTQTTPATPGAALQPTRQVTYLPAQPWWQIFLMGDFSIHGAYWGGPKADSCFEREPLVSTWLGRVADPVRPR